MKFFVAGSSRPYLLDFLDFIDRFYRDSRIALGLCLRPLVVGGHRLGFGLR